jgi:DNA polymerase II large subunit
MNSQVKVQGVINLHKKKRVISESGNQNDNIKIHFLSQKIGNLKELNSQSGKTLKHLWDCL